MGTASIPSAAWKKSSKSYTGNCVEIALAPGPGTILVRDSKSPDKGMLTFQSASWSSFIQAVKSQAFDLQ